MTIEFRKNEFPVEILAQHRSYLICKGCLLVKAVFEVKGLVESNRHYYSRVPELLAVADQNYDIQAMNEEVAGLDTSRYSITLMGQEIIGRIGNQALSTHLPDPERDCCRIL